ncbi:MAG: PASTA domain-containing protein [Clostridiales bacterium]|nr:PASTA domain-containing protein [Clostridiales bacterium]
MKNKITTIAIMLVTISIMTSACLAVKTKDSDKDKKETTEAATVAGDVTETSGASDEKGATEDTTAESTAKASEDTVTTTAASTETTPAATDTEATTETTTAEIPKEDCELVIDVTYDENIVLAKYTVVLYLDGEKIESMENGKFFLTKVATTTGDHELKFEKRGDSTFETTVKVTLSGDSTVIFEIKSHLDEIEIKSSRLADGLQDIEAEMPDVTEMRLDRAIEALEAAGFKNISTESKSPIILKSNWVVIAQNFSAGEKTNRAAEIILTCEKDG